MTTNITTYTYNITLGKLATHDVLKTAPIFYLFSTVQQRFVKRRLFSSLYRATVFWSNGNVDFYPLRHLLPSLLACIVALVET